MSRSEGDPHPDLKWSRREVLRAGLIGAGALSVPAVVRPPAAGGGALRTSRAVASPAGAGEMAPGVYGLNQGWLFGGRYVRGAELPHHRDRRFARVTLPHTVTPLSWGDWNPRSWEHVWIYRRHLTGPWRAGTRVFVDFQGVMTNADVYLDGAWVGEHEGGYLPWSVELTEHLTGDPAVLAVVVDSRWVNVPPQAGTGGAGAIDFLQPGGIYRDVALRVTPGVFVADVFAKPTDVLSSSPGLEAEVTLDASYLPRSPVTVVLTLLDGATQLATTSTTVPLRQVGQTVTTLILTGLAGIELWSPDIPKLYQVMVTVIAGDEPHSIQVNVGFREATFQPDGLYVNGQRVQVFGLNRHQLFPYTGMAAPERLQRRDAELIRVALGCNMVRCSHYPQSPHFLDACDELGLMVWEEPPGWQHVGDTAAEQIVEQNVRDMVVRDRNRPSVIVWATRLDETTGHDALYAQTRELAYSLDGTRQTTGAMHVQSLVDWAEDVFAYDDYHGDGANAELLPPIPAVPYLVSEAVGARDGAPLYRWVDPGAILGLQGRLHAQVHGIARSSPAYGGVLAWSGMDYASLNGIARTWHNLKWTGVLDTFRVAKPAAAIYASQVDPSVRPVIAPLFFWDFGPSSPVDGPGSGSMIATNCDRLQLYVDGQPFATALPDTQDFGNLPHPPAVVDLGVDGTTLPELLIEGYVGGQLVASLRMSSNPQLDRLVLAIEDHVIRGDGSDATRFTFRALDAYGNQRPYASGEVSLLLAGPAILVAENPFSFSVYGGVGGGLVQSRPGISGTVNLVASHPTLGESTGTVTVEPAAAAGAAGAGGCAPPVVNQLAPPTEARVVRALAAALRPHGRGMTVGRLLRRGGYEFTFHSPFSGRLSIDWYHVVRRGRGRRAQLLAHARVPIRRVGPVRVAVRLTPRGRRLLAGAAGQEPLVVHAVFEPSGGLGPRTAVSRLIRLR